MKNYCTDQKGNASVEAVGGLFVIILIIIGISSLFGFNWGKTYTGGVDTDNCRAVVQLNEGDWETYWHKFYCTPLGSGTGICAAVSMTDGQCDTSYFYTQSGTSNITSTPENSQTGKSSSTQDASPTTSRQYPTEKCVTESDVKICDLSYSIQQTFGDGTRNASFQANAIDCLNVATGNQTQNQGDTVQVDSGNTYCAADIGAVYIDPTIQVAKYFNKIMTNGDGNYYVPTTYSTCIWTSAGGSGYVPDIAVSNNIGPMDSQYNVRAFCKNGNNQVDIYSYKGS